MSNQKNVTKESNHRLIHKHYLTILDDTLNEMIIEQTLHEFMAMHSKQQQQQSIEEKEDKSIIYQYSPPSSPSPSLSVTPPSLSSIDHRICFDCLRSCSRSDYSKTQWNQKKDKALCKQCMEKKEKQEGGENNGTTGGAGKSMNDQVSSLPFSSSSSNHTSPSSSLLSNDRLAVVPVEGKGLGVIANRDYSVGEIIYYEAPFFVFSLNLDLRSNQEIKKAIHQLSEADQKEYYSFTNMYDGTNPLVNPLLSSMHNKELGIFRTNLLPLENGTKGGLFRICCRLNHSCQSNVRFMFNDDIKQERLTAIKSIKKGEELVINYREQTGLLRTYQQRQSELIEGFGFKCQCRLCAASIDIRQRSDQRRKKIIEFDYKIKQQLSQYGNFNKVIKLCDQQWLLLEEMRREEGVISHHTNFGTAYRAFQAAFYLENILLMKKWINEVYSNGFIVEGGDYQSKSVKKLYLVKSKLENGIIPEEEECRL